MWPTVAAWGQGPQAKKKKGEKSLKKEQLQKSFKPKDSNCLRKNRKILAAWGQAKNKRKGKKKKGAT